MVAEPAYSSTFADAATQRRVGFGLDPGVQMGPVISPESRARVVKAIDQAVAEGARPLADGSPGPARMPIAHRR